MLILIYVIGGFIFYTALSESIEPHITTGKNGTTLSFFCACAIAYCTQSNLFNWKDWVLYSPVLLALFYILKFDHHMKLEQAVKKANSIMAPSFRYTCAGTQTYQPNPPTSQTSDERQQLYRMRVWRYAFIHDNFMLVIF